MSLSIKPNRIVINAEGDAVPPDQAIKLGITWDVIFVRNDGWSLGAPHHLAEVANSLWVKEWVAQIRDGKIEQY